MKNKVISSLLLLTLVSSLFSFNVFATEIVETPTTQTDDVIEVVEPSEEELKRLQAKENLDFFKETFNKNLVKPEGVSNISVVEIVITKYAVKTFQKTLYFLMQMEIN